MSTNPQLEIAAQYAQTGRFNECEAICRNVLEENPGEAEAYRLLATVAYFRQDLAEAARNLEKAIELRPNVAEYYDNLSVLRMSEKRPAEAAAAAQQGLALAPTSTLYHRMGTALRALGRLEEAEAALRQAIDMDPRHSMAWFDLAGLLSSQGKLAGAEQAYRQVLAARPDTIQAVVNLANVLQNQERLPEAIEVYQKAVQLRPDIFEVHYNLANALKSLGQLSTAIAQYERALKLKSDSPEGHNNLGGALLEQGRVAEAFEHFRAALVARPAHYSAHSNLLVASQYQLGVTLPSLHALHADWDQKYAQPLQSAWQPHTNSREPERPLKLGFVSSDLGRHPVGHYVARVIESLDRNSFLPICYSDRLLQDDVTKRIATAAAGWHDTKFLSDERLAEQIRADEIDILLDLAGHTHGNRLLTFARKPAPLAVSWLGYMSTTGLSAIDYMLTDQYLTPKGVDKHYQEKLLRLKGGIVYCEPPEGAPPVGPSLAQARGHVILGSFNNPTKIGPEVYKAWSEILRRVPTARLVLKHRAWEDQPTRAQGIQQFESHGIDPQRLSLVGWSPMNAMLADYHDIDLALDPFPYTGGSTTWLALWMGVPVVTWPGETAASRQSLSLLSHASLTELVAPTLPAYLDLAESLATDPTRLAELRAGMRERLAASSLCDLDRFVGEFSTSLRTIWRTWCEGDKPKKRKKKDDVHLL